MKKPLELRKKLLASYRRFQRTIFFRITKGFVLIGVVVLIGYAISNLNLFYIEDFVVEGFAEEPLRYISQEDVEDLLFDYTGERLFLVDTSEIRDSMLDEFPFAEEVYVTKHIPDVITVRIVEKKPIITLRQSQRKKMFDSVSDFASDDIVIIDAEGFVVGSCAEYPGVCEDLPVCTVTISGMTYTPGDEVYFTEFASIIDMQVRFAELDIEVESFVIPESQVVVVVFAGGTRGIFTTRKSIEDQLDSYEYTRENLKLKGKKYKELDFRYEHPFMLVDKYTDWVIE